MNWPLVPLGEVLTLDIDAVQVDPVAAYPIAGVYSFGRGLLAREPLAGSATTYKTFHRLHTDQIVLSQLKAWEGAIARVPASFDGWFLSPQFPTFRANPARLEIGFLDWYCKQSRVWEELRTGARGMGARRDSVSPARFLSLEVPLPPLVEQRRIVARVDAIAARVTEARRLREELDTDNSRVLIQMAHRADMSAEQKAAAGWREVRLGEVIAQVQDPVSIDTSASYPNIGIYSYAKGLFHKAPISGLETSATTLYRVKAGQFIYSRLFAFEGSYGQVTPEFDGQFVSGEYPTFNCPPDTIRSEFLAAYFKAKSIWAAVAVGSKGLGDRRQRVQPQQLLQCRLWLPPISWQAKIADVQAKLDAVRAEQSATAAELDALLPSVLNRAFAGEL